MKSRRTAIIISFIIIITVLYGRLLFLPGSELELSPQPVSVKEKK